MSVPGPVKYSRAHLALTKDVVHVLQNYAPDSEFLQVASSLGDALTVETNESASVHWPATESQPTNISVELAPGCAITPAVTSSRHSHSPRGVLKKPKIQWNAPIAESLDDGLGGTDPTLPRPAFTGATPIAGSAVSTITEGVRASVPSESPVLASTPATQTGHPGILLTHGITHEESSDDNASLFSSTDDDSHCAPSLNDPS